MIFLISVIIPCYNCEDTLQKCVDSVLGQSCSYFEVVLVDDGATDNTGQICERIAKDDNRIRVIHQDNQGLMATWKRGVKESLGDYIVFVDSDDWIENDLLEKIYAIIEKERPDMITYGVRTDYSDGTYLYLDNRIRTGLYRKNEIEKEILPKYFYDDGMGTMAILPPRPSKAVKKNILLENMYILKDNFSIGEDDITSFAILLDVQTVYNIGKYYPYHYCRRKGSMLGSYTVETAKRFVEVKKELFCIAGLKKYKYKQQIMLNFGENILVVIKKIMVDMAYDIKRTEQYIRDICGIQDVEEFLYNKSILKKFGISENIMAALLRVHAYRLCIYLSRIVNRVIKGPTI